MSKYEPFSNALAGHTEKNGRQNGPHKEAKWAQHLLGTDETAGQRKRRLVLARQRQYEIAVSKAIEKDIRLGRTYGKFTSKPQPAAMPRGLTKAMKGVPTT